MKITKNELKEMIRETLREELASIKESVETLDVSASEVDDLARDVYIDAEFEDAYKADGYTVGEAVEALIVEVISSEYPDIDLGSVPDRVSNALSNMISKNILTDSLHENFVHWNEAQIATGYRSFWDVMQAAEDAGYKFVYGGTKEEKSRDDLLAYYSKVDSEYGRLFRCVIDDDRKEVLYSSYAGPLW